MLTAVYCLGLGLPFVARRARLPAGARRVRRGQAALRRRDAIGGGLLVAVGVLLVTGAWNTLVDDLRGSFTGYDAAGLMP